MRAPARPALTTPPTIASAPPARESPATCAPVAYPAVRASPAPPHRTPPSTRSASTPEDRLSRGGAAPDGCATCGGTVTAAAPGEPAPESVSAAGTTAGAVPGAPAASGAGARAASGAGAPAISGAAAVGTAGVGAPCVAPPVAVRGPAGVSPVDGASPSGPVNCEAADAPACASTGEASTTTTTSSPRITPETFPLRHARVTRRPSSSGADVARACARASRPGHRALLPRPWPRQRPC